MVSLPPVLRTRRARALAAAFAALVALRIALPYALAAGLAWGGERATGVPVSVANVDLGLLRGRVVVDGLTVAGPDQPPPAEGAIDPETALVRWSRLELNLEWLELLRGRVRLSELRWTGPTARVELDASGAPILPQPPADDGASEPEPAEPDPSATEPAEPTEAGPGWPIEVDRLEISDLDVRVLDGHPTPAVALGLEALRLTDVSFDKSGLGLGSIGFDAPSLRVRRDFVLAGSASEPGTGEPAEEAEPAPESETSAPATYRMDELHIENANFIMLTEAGPMDVSLQIEAKGVTTEVGERFPIQVRLDLGPGAFEIAGELGANPPTFRGQLHWRDLPLSPFTRIARPDLAGWLTSKGTSGELEVGLRLEPEGAEPAGLMLRGNAVSRNLLLRDPESEDLALGWKRLAIPIDEVFIPLGDGAETKPIRVALGGVRLEEPRLRYGSPTTALDQLLGLEEEGAEPEPGSEANAPPGPDPVVTVASFELVDGELRYRDRSLRPDYQGRVRKLAISLRDLRLPAATVGSVSLSARLPVRSTLSLEGSHGSHRSRLKLGLERLALPPLSPFAIDAAGYRVDQGDLSLETTAKRVGERWEVSNQLLLHRLDLSTAGTGKLDQLIGIPVDLALALLRDLQGDIHLGIPVDLDRNGLRIGLGSVVRDALRAAIAGAVTSPLKMMGAAFSFGEGGGLAVEPFRMAAGDTQLEDGQTESLAALAVLLESRPELAVRLQGGSTPGDRDALAERILANRVAAGGDLPDLDGAGFFARRRVRGALEKRGRGEAGALGPKDAELLARYRTATYVPPDRFAALARARARALAATLTATHGIAVGLVRVADEPDTEQAGVRVRFEAD